MEITTVDFSKLLGELTDIGTALSAEKDHNRLLEMILLKAKALTNADGGTLYIRTEDGYLNFEIVLTESLNLHRGGTSGEPVGFSPIPLYDADGKPNNSMVATSVAMNGVTVNIENVYADERFDFSGTREFDLTTGYSSRSFLTVSLTNHENENIGVLQLLNAIDPVTGGVIPFSSLDQQVVESLASHAAVTVTTRNLIDAQQNLFDSMIKLIANAIDEKSPYTAGHCRRVPTLTNLLAEAACKVEVGPLQSFNMTDDEKYALDVAAWLHDCGKITTPEYVVDKSTKLEALHDRISEVDTRFEVLKRDRMIEMLSAKLQEHGLGLSTDEEASMRDDWQLLDDSRRFLHRCNIGGESMAEEDIEQVRRIAGCRWGMDGMESNLLTDEEVNNLIISRGTLTDEEREIINNHIVVTNSMLESLPYPKHLANVPEYAGGHHEKMDGSGYPRGLTREEMSLPARMMAIADIFEALTASDRPYKKGMPLSQALQILGEMKLNHHIDPDLFDVFMHERLYLKYADEFLEPEQIDEVIPEDVPGYQPLSFT